MVLGTLCSNLLEQSRVCSASDAAAAAVTVPDEVLCKNLLAAHLVLLRILRAGAIAAHHPIAIETSKSHHHSPSTFAYAHEVITDIFSQSELSHFVDFSCPVDLSDLQLLETDTLQSPAASVEDDVVHVAVTGNYLDEMAQNLSGIVSSVMGSSSSASAQVPSRINLLLGPLVPCLFKAGFVLWSLPRLHTPGKGTLSARVITSAILRDCMLHASAVATRSVLIVWDKNCAFCTKESRQSGLGFGSWAEGFGGGMFGHVAVQLQLFTSVICSACLALRIKESELHFCSRHQWNVWRAFTCRCY
jgi:hypothetical protein